MGSNTRNGRRWPTLSESLRETLVGLGNVVDVKQTLKEFDEMEYEKPVRYSRRKIVDLRRRKLRMSQAVFARICNIRLSTLQKWERGVSRPTLPVDRLFQLVEHGALDLVRRTNQ